MAVLAGRAGNLDIAMMLVNFQHVVRELPLVTASSIMLVQAELDTIRDAYEKWANTPNHRHN